MATHGLSAEQKRSYDQDGYILVKSLISRSEAAELRREMHELADRLRKIRDIDATWHSSRQAEPEKRTIIYHCHDVQFYSAAAARLIVDPRLTSVAQSIIGPNVQLHHTKMFIKPPEKGSPFPMHQDVPYFPHDRHSMIAAIVHFDDAPLEKGCLRVVPGSHKLGVLHSDRPDYSLSPQDYPIEKATAIPASAGDAIFFSYLTIHGSGVNTSQEARTTILVQMRDPQDPPTIRTHESRGQGMMLAGIDPSCCTTKASNDKPAGPAMGAMGGGTGR
jgi:ectoine hydroxylase-related dioxygenase (phytanoyl-CoA dioxygenase family)